jgi:trans-aconitate methyltransferase
MICLAKFKNRFMKNNPISVFGRWAEDGRDEGMAKGHLPAVNHMLGVALDGLKNFRFIDAGCGNGWVVRKVSQLPECKDALGVDGAEKMVEKATSLDTKNSYECANLMSWQPKKTADLVHSMEVFYYVSHPDQLIQNIYNHWLKKNGRLIMGVDFYTENNVSHSWPEDCGVQGMQLFSEAEWQSFFKNAGFVGVRSWRFGAKEGWTGTLVVMGVK